MQLGNFPFHGLAIFIMLRLSKGFISSPDKMTRISSLRRTLLSERFDANDMLQNLFARADRTLSTRIDANDQKEQSASAAREVKQSLAELRKEIVSRDPLQRSMDGKGFLLNSVARAERVLANREGIEEEVFVQQMRKILDDLQSEIDQMQKPEHQIQNTTKSVSSPLFKPRPIGPEDIMLNYGQNPTITSTALAQHLWRHVLRPGVDSAIDATAGNGHDSVVLARMLFLDGESPADSTTQSRLVSVDIQEEACANTRRELEKVLPEEIMNCENVVKVVHGSHSPLPLPDVADSLALVVYNLGYLPNSSKEYYTQTHSTLASLTCAIQAIRIGGLLSVMTYPRSNRQEDWAVHVFLEGLALFTSVSDDWREYVRTVDIPASVKERETVDTREIVLESLEKIWGNRTAKETWRVHEHRKLGWIDAPILLTAYII